jgi:hypothetical protein
VRLKTSWGGELTVTEAGAEGKGSPRDMKVATGKATPNNVIIIQNVLVIGDSFAQGGLAVLVFSRDYLSETIGE